MRPAGGGRPEESNSRSTRKRHEQRALIGRLCTDIPVVGVDDHVAKRRLVGRAVGRRRRRLVELDEVHIAVEAVDHDMSPGAAIGGPDHRDLLAMRHRGQDLRGGIGLVAHIAVIGGHDHGLAHGIADIGADASRGIRGTTGIGGARSGKSGREHGNRQNLSHGILSLVVAGALVRQGALSSWSRSI